MTTNDARTIKRLERELSETRDAKRRAFLKATINLTLHRNGLPSKYEDYR